MRNRGHWQAGNPRSLTGPSKPGPFSKPFPRRRFRIIIRKEVPLRTPMGSRPDPDSCPEPSGSPHVKPVWDWKPRPTLRVCATIRFHRRNERPEVASAHTTFCAVWARCRTREPMSRATFACSESDCLLRDSHALRDLSIGSPDPRRSRC